MPPEKDEMSKKAIIIGAGPAGLTAAYELLMKTDIVPVILEKSADIGGISKTVEYKGNRMDIGGHRFFSKSDRVMNWWLNILPLEQTGDEDFTIRYRNAVRTVSPKQFTAGPAGDKIMLVRNRLSRIYYLRRFFVYPISLTADTIRKLGWAKLFRIGFSYLKARLRPRPERSLEDFFINRFGSDLYRTFFKDYTEKVWGMPCTAISAQWGAQRIKGLSVSKALAHALRQPFKKDGSLAQKDTQTSLIDRFLYPRLGPGQLWEEVARIIQEKGGQILLNHATEEMYTAHGQVQRVVATNSRTGEKKTFEGDYFFSTMPIKELVAGLHPGAPEEMAAIASGLQYRDFVTVGLLLRKLRLSDEDGGLIKDNWIYIQEKDVKIGRLQVFNNWSPFMVREPGTVWLGLEYFCNVGDDLWNKTDEDFMRFAAAELEQIGIIDRADVLDSTIIRMEKTYPAYFGTYNAFDSLRQWLDGFENLFLVGRNGMHKYNNSDHSMLTAMTAVENIISNTRSKDNIWAINTEDEYHEER
jgi:protoporphyrinogen oxidase